MRIIFELLRCVLPSHSSDCSCSSCGLSVAKISGWELCDASFMGSFWVKVAVTDAFGLQVDKLCYSSVSEMCINVSCDLAFYIVLH